MGESKRRKAQDPSYGRPIRGLILTSQIVLKENSVRVHGSLDPRELRYALLFLGQAGVAVEQSDPCRC